MKPSSGSAAGFREMLSVMNNGMDDQHKRLVELVNRLYSSMKTGKANTVVGSILDELIEYTATHFKDEEALMQVHKFPALEPHQALHAELVSQALDIQKRFHEGIPIGTETLNFLKGWLINHIQQVDRRYGEYLTSRGIA